MVVAAGEGEADEEMAMLEELRGIEVEFREAALARRAAPARRDRTLL